ncbi:RES domain-containing protein [Roseospira visakhapatnamensis]|uniref:RES domain-containing protein n=1 Tax=Roseospira visakhapatnamensis TaxID=390880 RepID=A0A7W6RDN6_9PROT|nr:RES domain-containing protein [Roseospira visakhapatnamensis]MBB4266542.1 hypothetical protein [Roseospira visakhapatnamensis]
MSLPTWTPDALASEARAYIGDGWRLVEAQHLVSTQKLVDTADEQTLLEEILEDTKPPVPPECRHVHYLLFTPFRYGPYPHGSRFRRAGRTAGVFYAAEAVETAVAEMAFYRLLFFAESPGTPWPANAATYAAFAVALETTRALDLTAPPLNRDRAIWTHPTDHGPCQTLAEAARAANIALLKADSVRDPERGATLAALSCAVFARPDPIGWQTWYLRPGPAGVQAVCEWPSQRLTFGRDAFAADPRVIGMVWARS